MAKIIRTMTEEEVLAAITDEMAQADGYPDAESVRLEHQLSKLAAKWAIKKDPTAIKEYHDIYHTLVNKGWNPDTLTVQEVLPEALMPKHPERVKA